MTIIRRTARWDAITTPQGHVVLVLPPCPRPRAVVLAEEGVYVGTAGVALLLAESRRLASIVRAARVAIVAEADDMIRRETAVPIVETVTHRTSTGDRR